MVQPNLMHRASQRCLRSLRRTLSRDKTRPDDKSSISGRSSTSWSSFSTASLFTTKNAEEDECMVVDETIPEDPENDTPAPQLDQFHYFPRLPAEIRQQIYREFWVVAGVERHLFLHNRKLMQSPCITDHTAPDERQIGVAKAFATSGSGAEVQPHPEWYKRMTSKWCNHWKCERLWEDVRDGKEIDAHKTSSYMSLLLSCKWIYGECHETFKEYKTVTITDGQTLQRVFHCPRPTYLYEATYINISLREDSGNYLYLNGASLWHILSDPDFKVSRVYLWLDAECPVTRRLLTEFRELVNCVPSSIAPRLTIDFPCDAEDGFWAWDEVEVETQDGGCGGGRTTNLERLVHEFTVVARGRQRFNETSGGYISNADRGRPRRKVLRASNPFEDVLLYGRGFHDDAYV